MSAGEPFIGMPMFGEQWNSSDKCMHQKIDPKLNLNTLTEEKFDTALKTLLNDNRYRKNIVTLRQMMFERTEKPIDRAIWWSESVIRNGGARHLAPSSTNIFGAQYLQSQPVFIYTNSKCIQALKVDCGMFNPPVVRSDVRRPVVLQATDISGCCEAGFVGKAQYNYKPDCSKLRTKNRPPGALPLAKPIILQH
ncbi:UDP-glucuronosyltransferase 2B17 [Papilio xuthus]|uniref:UDP-glucuronosyltransferase 2B17 n=1 Tax=Papilio xuthus TaxID=66420 RepID=A0A194PIV3_PAPXU|nr:UDP-glucuronosyltransferase 2B17 [Papilio xuthus]